CAMLAASSNCPLRSARVWGPCSPPSVTTGQTLQGDGQTSYVGQEDLRRATKRGSPSGEPSVTPCVSLFGCPRPSLSGEPFLRAIDHSFCMTPGNIWVDWKRGSRAERAKALSHRIRSPSAFRSASLRL